VLQIVFAPVDAIATNARVATCSRSTLFMSAASRSAPVVKR
jgi:hypothetical protein